MSRKSLLKSESAAAVAIAAVLLLGLAFTIISVVKLNYAPEWKIDAERDYSYDAWSNMEDVKTRADIFTWFMISDINYPGGLSATVPFSMGGGDVPVFEPSKSNSKLAVNTEECIISISLAKYPTPQTVDCGGVTYYSENRQYPDQVFRYENGALILAQGENSQMKRNPSFDIEKIDTNGNYTVTINAINLTGEPKLVSSSTSTALRLTGDSIKPFLNSSKDHPGENIDAFNLSISTHYTDAWATYLNNTAKGAGFVYGTDYTIESIPEDHVCISFLPTGNNYSIYANQTIICAELGRKEVLPKGTTPVRGDIMELGQWYNFDIFTGTYDNSQLPVAETNPDLLKDYDEDCSLLSTQVNNEELISYNKVNDFCYDMEKNQKVLNLTFGFNDFSSFNESTPLPTKATVRMIYSFNNTNNSEVKMTLNGNGIHSFKPSNKWILYKETYSISSASPADLKLNLKITTVNGKDAAGKFHIDYLAVRLD